MLDWFLEIDVSLFKAINGLAGGALSPKVTNVLNSVMWYTSMAQMWIPLYVILLVAMWMKFTQRNSRFIITIGIIVTLALADTISARILKPTAARLRPSHQIELAEDLNLQIKADGTLYRGGKYGFVSSHAANHMAIAIFVGGLLSSASSSVVLFALVFWAFAIGLSRVYLGVHFPSDVFFGWMLGGMLGLVVLKLAARLNTRFAINTNTINLKT